jgi:lipopolysaccharide transport system ATP-binding protein
VNSNALTVSQLGKAFLSYHSEWQRVMSWFGAPVKPAGEHWVLRNVDFSVARGDAVGVVGENGAGKSTLLKLIAGTLRPTEGSVHVYGRVAAILELGMGFNPELTGRQNALHAGGLMGVDRGSLQKIMPAIEAFADIDEYFDQPIRTYSSGMQVRVAFSVATAFRPELLIIDEALAVGDAAFQRKCFQRIETFRADGTTLLFVSHDIETVKRLCSHALFIKNGQLGLLGPAKVVCDKYEQYLFGGEATIKQSGESLPTRFDPSLATSTCELVYGNGKAAIEWSRIENSEGQHINVADSGQPFVWRYRVDFKDFVSNPVFAMMIKTREGVAVYGVDSTRLGVDHRNYGPGESVEVRFELANGLAPGLYYLNCGVRETIDDHVQFLCRRVDTAIIRITEGPASTALVGLMEMGATLAVTAASGRPH